MKRAVACAALVSTLGAVAAARDLARVVVVRDERGAVANRVAAEAAAAGLDVIETTAGGSDDRALARRYDARAVVRTTAAGSIALYVEPGDGAPPITDAVDPVPGDDEDQALRAVERLRAHFVDLGIVKPEPPAPAADRAAAGRPPEPRADSYVGVEVGPVVVIAQGGFDPAVAAALGARFVSGGWGAGLFATVPLSGLEVEHDDVGADGRVNFVGARVVRRFGSVTGVVVPELGAALSVVALSFTGDADPPLRARSDTLLAAAGTLEAALAVRAGPAIRVRALAAAGGTAPRPVVRFEGKEAAAFGRGIAMLGLSIDVDVGALVAPAPAEAAP